jgi:hypothetical protein
MRRILSAGEKQRLLRWIVSGLLVIHSGVGCSAQNLNVRVGRNSEGRLQVAGPLAGPFQDLETLARNACELLTRQPGADNGAYGFEYCGLYYHSPADSAFFLSYLSDLSSSLPDGSKTCTVPRLLDDPGHPDAIVLGSVHNHPHNRRFSENDLSAKARWRPTRIADKNGRVWSRNTMMFHREKSGACSVYLFNNHTLTVAALRDNKWVDIGVVSGDQGYIQLLDGMDWLPSAGETP